MAEKGREGNKNYGQQGIAAVDGREFVWIQELRSHLINTFVFVSSVPHGLKPNIYFVEHTARLKSCPDTSCNSD
jgi:hypothetical protein